MAKRKRGTPAVPVKYPSVAATTARFDRHDEPPLRVAADRVPVVRFAPGDTRADLRMRVEALLRRKEAASAEAWAGLGPAAGEVLADLVTDETVRADQALWHRVIATVGLLSIDRAVPSLSAVLTERGNSAASKAQAANALGRIGAPTAIEALASAAGDKDDMVRRQAAIALGRIDRAAVIPHLARLGADKSIAVAEVAAAALVRRNVKPRSSGATARAQRAAPSRTSRKRRPSADIG